MKDKPSFFFGGIKKKSSCPYKVGNDAAPLPLPPGEVSERSEDGEGDPYGE